MKLTRLAVLFLVPIMASCATARSPSTVVPAQAFQSDRIQITTHGSGPDVILIPGLGSSPQIWEGTVAALPGYRYHIVQVGGFAGAPSGANADGPVIAPVADEIVRYADTQGLHDPAVVGHSMGGTLAMMIAARRPGLASKVMVVDMVPFLGALLVPSATSESIEPVAAQMRSSIGDPNRTAAAREASAQQTIATMVRTESLRSGPIEDTLASDPAVVSQAMYDLVTTDLRTQLAAIDVPVSVLWVHAPNAAISEQQMSDFYRLSFANTPQATITQVDDSYHFIMFDAPDQFRDALANFLEN